jgi:hypothetical protein
VDLLQQLKTTYLKMNRIALVLLMLFLCVSGPLSAQDNGIKGKVAGKIFTNAYTNLTGDLNETATAFEVRRAYFGWENEFGKGFSAFVKLDIGSINDDSEYALIKRYTYFKNAGFAYSAERWEAAFGLIDTYQFKLQEKFWGRRYIRKSFQDEFKWNSSADLGVFAKYKLTSVFQVDVMIANGEGYTNFQYDDYLRYSAGLVALPGNFQFRVGFDISPNSPLFEKFFTHFNPVNSVTNTAYGVFAGYKYKNFKIGADANYEFNYRNVNGRDRYGYSVYADYYLKEKWNVFARYDQLFSNNNSAGTPWNLARDGSAVLAGVEYVMSKNLSASLNYQDWSPYAANLTYGSALFLNFEINF